MRALATLTAGVGADLVCLVTTILDITFTFGRILPAPFTLPPTGLAVAERALRRAFGPVDEKRQVAVRR